MVGKNNLLLIFGIMFLFFLINNVSAVGVAVNCTADSSIVLCYHFNNDSSIGENDFNVTDSSLSSNNATTNNTIFVPNSGILNDGSFSFNGINSSIIPINQTFLSHNGTISVWVYINSTSTGTIIGTSLNSRMTMLSTNNRITMQLGQPLQSLSSPIGSLLNGTWTYITFTYNIFNATTTNNSLYINGILSSQLLTNDSTTNPLSFKIGIAQSGSGTVFNGSIDEMIVYNRQLSDHEIWVNYHNYLSCINITKINTPVRDYTKICPNIYRINNSPIININNSNTYINFSGSSFIGNNTGNFIQTSDPSNLKNITIDSLNITGYSYASWFRNISDVKIFNSWIDTSANGFFLIDDSVNISIFNNHFGFQNSSPTVSGIYFRNSGINEIIYNNNFMNCISAGCIRLHNMSNSDNITILNNTMNGPSPIKILITGLTQNVLIINNSFNDSNNNFDSYNVGIHIYQYYPNNRPNNITINYNNFTNIGCVGILTQGVSNLSILNNYFQYNSSIAYNEKANCGYEAPTAIDLASVWKTWTSDSTELSNDNKTKILNYSSSNTLISNNTINGFPVLLRASSPINLTHDLTNYWFRSFATPDYLLPRQDYYISNSFNNVSTTFNETNNNPVVVTDILGERYPGYSTSIPWIQFNIYKSYLHFLNNNYSVGYNGTYNPYNGIWSSSTFNNTKSLIYNTNGSVSCSDINNCNGNINFTLSPFNESYVLDNFNLTENIAREFSPLWFSQSSSTEKHIASNLSQAINATVVITLQPSDIARLTRISYTSHSGWTENFERSQMTFDGNNVQINVNNIEPAQSSNVLEMVYGCNSALEAGTLIAIKIMAALAIVIFNIVLFYNRDTVVAKVGTKGMIVIFIGTMIGLVMVMAISDGIFTYCGI